MRAILVAFLDGVLTGAAWAGFALLGLAAVTWLLDWGHLLGPVGDGERSRVSRVAALVGLALLVGGLAGLLLDVGG